MTIAVPPEYLEAKKQERESRQALLARLVALRDRWLDVLERDAQDGANPTYEDPDARFEWSEWRWRLTRSVREVSMLIREERG